MTLRIAIATGIMLIPLFFSSLQAKDIRRNRLQDIVVECAQCHGADGVSKSETIPNLGGQNKQYLLDQLLLFRSGRRVHKEMRFMSRLITLDELNAIADYYSKMPNGALAAPR